MRRNGLSLLMLGSSLASFLLAGPLLLAQEQPAATSVAEAQGAAVSAEPPALQPLAPAAGDPLYAPVVISPLAETLQDRLMEYAINTIGPRSLLIAPLAAIIPMVDPPSRIPREWHMGVAGFARNSGNALAAETSLQTGRFLVGALLHEDFRYRPSTSRNPFVRSFHALAFTFVDKSDSGDNRIAFANFAGAAAGGFVGNLYLPPGFRDPSHADTRMAYIFGGFAVQNLLREFAPDLLNSTHKSRIPFPHIPLPEWWVKLRNH